MQGHVRSWVDWPEAGLLLLNMRGNRWCGNIGRAHKSNGVFYVIDLQACLHPACLEGLAPVTSTYAELSRMALTQQSTRAACLKQHL